MDLIGSFGFDKELSTEVTIEFSFFKIFFLFLDAILGICFDPGRSGKNDVDPISLLLIS